MQINATVSIEKITPQRAQELLNNRLECQRHVRDTHNERLATDMIEGRFKLSPDAITLVRGKLGNGQHRLQAVVDSGKAQQFIVLESNDEDIYKVTDKGIRRTVTDDFSTVEYSKQFPSVARIIIAYNNDEIRPHGGGGTFKGSVTKVIEFCEENLKSLQDSCRFVHNLYVQTHILPVSIGGALHNIGASIGKKTETEEFLKSVYIGGAESSATDYRNRLIKHNASRAKVSSGNLFGIGIKALRAYINGTRPSILKWSDGEDMPKLK